MTAEYVPTVEGCGPRPAFHDASPHGALRTRPPGISYRTVRERGRRRVGGGGSASPGRGRCAFRGARTPLQWHCPPLWLCAPRTAGRSLPPASVLGPPFRVPDGLGRLGPSCPQRGSGRGARGRQVAHLPGETASVQPKPRPHAHATGHAHTAHAHAEWRRPAPSAAEEWPPPERGWTHERVQSRWVPPAGQAMPGQSVHQDVLRSPTRPRAWWPPCHPCEK